MARFAHPDVVTAGWYVVGRSRKLRTGDVEKVPVGPRHVVVYRDQGGTARTVDAHCAHLGADLGMATVTTEGLRCAFHGWCWDGDGNCTTPTGAGRRVGSYPTRERDGLVWAWLGREVPAIDLPALVSDDLPHRVLLPPQQVRAHPHIVLGNGYDVAHTEPAHGFRLAGDPDWQLDPPHHMEITLRGVTPKRKRLFAFGISGRPFTATFRHHGGTLLTVDIERPLRFRILFTGRPLPGETCRTQTTLALPHRRMLPRALALLWNTTLEDIPLMESVRFHPGFTPEDEAFAAYARWIDALPTW